MNLLLEPSYQFRYDYSGYSNQQQDDGLPGCHTVADMRIVLVEWRIFKGQENLFLDYWSRRETIDDRSGLIGEFLRPRRRPCGFSVDDLRVQPGLDVLRQRGLVARRGCLSGSDRFSPERQASQDAFRI